jgi:predicted molibdopterin-dependent oxidoreductase YjgC
MFKRLSDAAPTVRVTVNGTALNAPAGESVAALLLVHAEHTFRTTAVSESPRAPYCMMGVCHDCLVEIDGVPNQQGCRVRVSEGMDIKHQSGAPELKP